MTSSYPGRVTRSHLSPIENGQAEAEVVLDQIRAVDRARLVRKLGRLEQRTGARVLGVLREMFAP